MDKSFGAEIKVTLPQSDQPQLFLVVFSSPNIRPAALIRAHQGQIVLDGGAWMIAELGFDEAMGLRNAKGIAFVGGISLDPQRFAAFSKLTGFNPLQQ
jgi:hypothetical protein